MGPVHKMRSLIPISDYAVKAEGKGGGESSVRNTAADTNSTRF